MQVEINSILYRSGDFFLNNATKKFLYTYIVGNNTSLIYINYWSILHFLSGVIVFLGLYLLGIKKYYIIALLIHTFWEFWQIAIGMTKVDLRGIIDIMMDTMFFMTGVGIMSRLLPTIQQTLI